jgi:hypothetical protein
MSVADMSVADLSDLSDLSDFRNSSICFSNLANLAIELEHVSEEGD